MTIDSLPLHEVLRGLLGPDDLSIKQNEYLSELIRRVATLTHQKTVIARALEKPTTKHDKDVALRQLRDALEYLLP